MASANKAINVINATIVCVSSGNGGLPDGDMDQVVGVGVGVGVVTFGVLIAAPGRNRRMTRRVVESAARPLAGAR